MSHHEGFVSKLQPPLIVCTLLTTISTLVVVSWASYSSYDLLQTLAADYTPQVEAAVDDIERARVNTEDMSALLYALAEQYTPQLDAAVLQIEAAESNSQAMVNMLAQMQNRMNPMLNWFERDAG